MTLLVTRTAVAPWPDRLPPHQAAVLDAVDACAVRAADGVLDVPWTDFEYVADDLDHFTPRGLVRFAEGLACAVRAAAPSASTVLLLSDSTVDHCNWEYDHDEARWERRGGGDACVRAAFADVSMDVVVDAVCGSGYAARAWAGEHFRARLGRHGASATPPPDAIVIVGGWNDVYGDRATAARACDACLKRARTLLDGSGMGAVRRA